VSPKPTRPNSAAPGCHRRSRQISRKSERRAGRALVKQEQKWALRQDARWLGDARHVESDFGLPERKVQLVVVQDTRRDAACRADDPLTQQHAAPDLLDGEPLDGDVDPWWSFPPRARAVAAFNSGGDAIHKRGVSKRRQGKPRRSERWEHCDGRVDGGRLPCSDVKRDSSERRRSPIRQSNRSARDLPAVAWEGPGAGRSFVFAATAVHAGHVVSMKIDGLRILHSRLRRHPRVRGAGSCMARTATARERDRTQQQACSTIAEHEWLPPPHDESRGRTSRAHQSRSARSRAAGGFHSRSARDRPTPAQATLSLPQLPFEARTPRRDSPSLIYAGPQRTPRRMLSEASGSDRRTLSQAAASASGRRFPRGVPGRSARSGLGARGRR
jgi:hypothetical protein